MEKHIILHVLTGAGVVVRTCMVICGLLPLDTGLPKKEDVNLRMHPVIPKHSQSLLVYVS